jgi:hypothetical protein
VHEFGADTESLLHYVYATPPMRQAAPNEALDFKMMPEYSHTQRAFSPTPAHQPQRSRTQSKRLAEAEAVLRARVRERLSQIALSRGPSIPFTPPRYDELFFEGQAWIDSLAGESPAEVSAEAFFSDDIWKSDARGEPGLP